MSSSGLDWEPLLQAWLRTRPHHEHSVITDLFSNNFLKIFTWAKQNLQLCLPVLQVNVISQVMELLCSGVNFVIFFRRVFRAKCRVPGIDAG